MQGLEIVGSEGNVANPMQFPSPLISQGFVRLGVVNDTERNVLVSETGNSYEINRVIKEAIFGEVRIGVLLTSDTERRTYQRTQTLVAIKIYIRSRLSSYASRVQENPMREIAAMQYLVSNGFHHPNIVRLIECVQDEHRVYSVLEYYDGGELFDVVDEHGALSEPQAKVQFKHVIDGLSYLQHRGVCHRDMSLENLLLCRDGRVVIIDFGMCLRVPVHPDTGAVFPMPAQGRCGKVNYMSPEVFESKEPFNGLLADIWALGVILFILLVGVPPMDFPGVADPRFVMIREGRLGDMLEQWSVSLSPAAVDLLQALLAPVPSKRPTIVQILAHPWMLTAVEAVS